MPLTEDATWNLETIFPGGVDGPAYQAALSDFSTRLERLVEQADALGAVGEDDAWTTAIPSLATARDELYELWTFASCHGAADTRDPAIRRAEARVGALSARYNRAWTVPDQRLARCDQDAFDALLADPAMAGLEGLLETARRKRPILLPEGEQALYDDLAEDAFHAWGSRYRRLSGALEVVLGTEQLSTAQAKNRMETADPVARTATFDAYETAWTDAADDCADALTHIIGVRQTRQRRLGVDDLTIALTKERLQPETVDALVGACHDRRSLLWRYLAARATLLGQDRVNWQDLAAPVDLPGATEALPAMDYAAAQDLVVREVASFSPHMGAFFERAIAEGWVEAEDRAGKRAGAFCAPLPRRKESRVFMTFGGGPGAVRVLAHELGHAYHNHVMADLPVGHRVLSSSLAETASTFAESVVRGALLRQAEHPAARLTLLDRELADAVTFVLNIPVRFAFERRLFELRAQGPLDPAVLSEEMEALQRAWYGPSLGRAFPLFWAEKLHFYLTRSPFYNFPYTYGYLFSSMVYARAQDEGPAWAETYQALLRATGRGDGEDVAARFLGADLRTPAPWTATIDRLAPLVDEYETLVAAQAD